MTDIATVLNKDEYTSSKKYDSRRNLFESASNLSSVYGFSSDLIVKALEDIDSKFVYKGADEHGLIDDAIKLLDVGAYDGKFVRDILDVSVDRIRCDVIPTFLEPYAADLLVERSSELLFGESNVAHVINEKFYSGLSKDRAMADFDIINMCMSLYHIEITPAEMLDELDNLLTVDRNSGYVFVTNVGDMFMTPLVDHDAITKVASLSNNLLGSVIADENDRFSCIGSYTNKELVHISAEDVKEYKENSMFSNLSDNYFDSSYQVNEKNPVILDFRVDVYRRNFT